MISPQELRHEGMCMWKFFHYNLKKYIKYHQSKEKKIFNMILGRSEEPALPSA